MQNDSSELHVNFGTGPLGLSVLRELIARSKRVRMINRSGKAIVPSGVKVVQGDAHSTEIARELCKGATVDYQCAKPPYNEWPQEFPLLQSSILEGAAAANAKLIIGENLYMYGEVDKPITENMPYAAKTRKGKVRAAMAEAAMAAHQSGKVRVAIGRGSDFFGPYMQEFCPRNT